VRLPPDLALGASAASRVPAATRAALLSSLELRVLGDGGWEAMVPLLERPARMAPRSVTAAGGIIRFECGSATIAYETLAPSAVRQLVLDLQSLASASLE
tara:strand:- start:219 stop:518 length:300 start_codon:yes stop_codon:yes gene_type:complete